MTIDAPSQKSPRDAYVGIDVAFAKRKRLPVCICVREGDRMTPLPLRGKRFPPLYGKGNAKTLHSTVVSQFASSVAECLDVIARVEQVKIRRIAVDAPRDYKAEGASRRACEVAMDERRISCFATPSRTEFGDIRRKAKEHLASGGAENRLPHANQLWMLVGFAIFRALEVKYECLEVFPQAIARTLGVANVHKSKAKGLESQLSAIAARTGWGDQRELEQELRRCCYGSAHDKVDAYMSAWIASLPEDTRTPLGNAPNDAIWVPTVV